ncbi:hypothetical protein Tco_0775631 [Tanacetum coccineum]
MEMKDTLSSCLDLDEQEIQQVQKQAKILKENSLNKLNALKTTTQHLSCSNSSMYYEFREAFYRLFNSDVGTFKDVLSRNMHNLERQLNKETLHEKDSDSGLNASARDQDSSGIVSDTRYDQSLENQSNTSRDKSSRSRNECNDKITSGDDTYIRSSYDTEPMVEVDSNTTPDSSDMCNNEFKDDQNADDHEDERVVLADLIANLKCDIDENKKIVKQLKNANTSLAHELEKCKSALEECKSSLGESGRTRD